MCCLGAIGGQQPTSSASPASSEPVKFTATRWACPAAVCMTASAPISCVSVPRSRCRLPSPWQPALCRQAWEILPACAWCLLCSKLKAALCSMLQTGPGTLLAACASSMLSYEPVVSLCWRQMQLQSCCSCLKSEEVLLLQSRCGLTEGAPVLVPADASVSAAVMSGLLRPWNSSGSSSGRLSNVKSCWHRPE